MSVFRGGPYVLITGGAGFIGSNLAHRLLNMGEQVLVLDNLSTRGAELNLLWLRQNHEDDLRFLRGDIRDRETVREAVKGAAAVFHLASHASRASAVVDPRREFETNSLGTLNLLEELWRRGGFPSTIFASSTSVYGCLEHVPLVETETRCEPRDPRYSAGGFNERLGMDPCTQEGCSKAAAECLVTSFARTYGLPAASLRLGDVYGPHQSLWEEPGTAGRIAESVIEEQPVEILGDGRQVTGLMFVDDATEALLVARAAAGRLQGRAWNAGGGPRSAASALELVDLLRSLHGHTPPVVFRDARPHQPRFFACDNTALTEATGWAPRVSLRQGLFELYLWICEYHRIPSRSGLLRMTV